MLSGSGQSCIPKHRALQRFLPFCLDPKPFAESLQLRHIFFRFAKLRTYREHGEYRGRSVRFDRSIPFSSVADQSRTRVTGHANRTERAFPTQMAGLGGLPSRFPTQGSLSGGYFLPRVSGQNTPSPIESSSHSAQGAMPAKSNHKMP